MDVKRCEWRTYGFLPGVVKPKDLLMRTLLFHKCAQVISENMHQPLGLAGCPSEFFLDGVSLNTLERVFLHISALQRGKASATVFSRDFFSDFPVFIISVLKGQASKQASQPASQHASTHAKHATSKQANTQTHTDLNKQPKPIRNQPEPNLKKPQTLNHHSTPTIQSQNTLKTSLE
jgi:hypothetical protein